MLSEIVDVLRTKNLEIKEENNAAAVKKLMKAVDKFDWKSWSADARKVMEKEFREVVKAQGKNTAGSIGISFDFNDPYVQKQLTNYVADRIEEMEEFSRANVKALIQRELETGVGTTNELGDKIQEAVREQYAGYADWRADRIARTETAIAYNHGTIFASKQAGISKVEVSDGSEHSEPENPECDCIEVDGEIWTLEQALARPTSHPNCVRAFAPVIEEDE